MFGLKKKRAKRRESERYPTFQGAEVYGTETKFRCSAVIRDISETGARLRISGGEIPPDHITIRVNGYDDTMRGRVCWRKNGDVGVEFDEKLKTGD